MTKNNTIRQKTITICYIQNIAFDYCSYGLYIGLFVGDRQNDDISYFVDIILLT